MTDAEELFKYAQEDMAAFRKSNGWVSGKQLPGDGLTGGNNVVTGCVNEKGEHLKNRYPCHAPIKNYKNALVLWSGFGWRTSEALAKKYFNWLITDSPWAKNGIVPSLEQDFMFNQGFIFQGLDKIPANLLHNFLIATRMAAEWPEMIEGWDELTKYGIDPAFAFAMLTVFVPWQDNYTGTNYCLNVDHCVLATSDKYDWPLDMGRADEAYVLNFVHGKAVGLSSRKYSPSAVTTPVNTLWGPSLTDFNNAKSYVVLLEKLYGNMAKVHKLKSFFGQSVHDIKSFTRSDIIEIIKLEQSRLGIKQERIAA